MSMLWFRTKILISIIQYLVYPWCWFNFKLNQNFPSHIHLGAVPGQGINIPQAPRYGQKKRKILEDIMADQVLKCAKTMLIREKNNAGWERRSESGRPRQGHWGVRARMEGITRRTGQAGLGRAAGRLDTAPGPGRLGASLSGLNLILQPKGWPPPPARGQPSSWT